MPGFAFDKSDVAPDPAVRYGRLPNGMRYALRHNETPAKVVVMQLVINAGSLVERDDQLGLAHFMEHMFFNGTTHVPEGQIVKRLERLGLQFGGDTNAGTTFDQTAYFLNLPSASDDVVDTALLMLREGAGEATLRTAAIDRERGVVLSEERTRAGPDFRAGRASLDFLMKGLLIPDRFPIGKVEILKSAPRERFVELYNGYYRPENAALVVVGDFDLDQMERKVRERFGTWRGQGAPGARPVLGTVLKRGFEAKSYVEPGLPNSITLVWNDKPDLNPDTRAERRETMIQNLGLAILNRRLTKLTLSDDAPITQAQAVNATTFKAIRQAAISATFRPGRWRDAIDAVEQEQRRMVQFGVTRAEMDRAIKETRLGFETQVASMATRDSGTLADALAKGFAEDKVVTTPQDRLDSFNAAVRDLTSEQVSATLTALFRGEGPLLFVTSPTPIEGGDTVLAAAFTGSQRVAVAPSPAVTDKAWAYANFGTPGTVVERRDIPGYDTTFVRFANGVRLLVRPSKLSRDNVLVSVKAGDGQLAMSPLAPNRAWAAREALIEGGLGKLDFEQIDDVLGGKRYNATLTVDEGAFTLSGATSAADLPTQLQVLAAFLTDPGWREQGIERARARALDVDRQLVASAGGVLNRELARLLRSGDPRAGTPTADTIRTTTMPQVREVLKPMFTEPLQVVIAGDIGVDEAIRRTAETFGALPGRRETPLSPGSARTVFPAGQTAPVVLHHGGRADQAVGVIAWPTNDFFADPREARVVDVLGAILRLRMLDILREKEGVTYSPSAGATSSSDFAGYGYVAASIQVQPDRMDRFFSDTLKIVRSLRDRQPSRDELQRAVAPMIAAAQRQRRSNDFWFSSLDRAQSDPKKLAALLSDIDDLQSVTPSQVRAAAQRYLADNKAFRVVALPGDPSPLQAVAVH